MSANAVLRTELRRNPDAARRAALSAAPRHRKLIALPRPSATPKRLSRRPVPVSALAISAHSSSADRCRADRTQKLKDARSEAQKEINEYKKLKEAEFNELESSVLPTVRSFLRLF